MLSSLDRVIGAMLNEISFIFNSIELFDKGFESESIRLATSIRVIMHDTQNSSSFFKLLGIKDEVRYYSTRIDSSISTEGAFLCKKTYGLRPFFMPIAKMHDKFDVYDKLSFEEWWDQIVIESGEYKVSRKNVVLDLANREGGAHFDDRLPQRYRNIVVLNSLNWPPCRGLEKSQNPFEVTMEGIAIELMKSLNDSMKILVKNKSFSRVDLYDYIKHAIDYDYEIEPNRE